MVTIRHGLARDRKHVFRPVTVPRHSSALQAEHAVTIPRNGLVDLISGGPAMLPYRVLKSGGTVRYAEFRNRLENALREVGLFVHDADRVETINLADTVRHWKAYIRRSAPPSAEPFSVSAEISFRWTPFDAARS